MSGDIAAFSLSKIDDKYHYLILEVDKKITHTYNLLELESGHRYVFLTKWFDKYSRKVA